MKDELYGVLKSLCEVRKDVPLSERCSFRIGGCAALAAFPENETALTEVIKAAVGYGERYIVFGNMTNVLISDAGFDGLAVFTSKLDGVCFDGESVVAGCGAPLTGLSSAARARGLSGLEFAYGIPGSVGGAVLMNAGAYGGCMADVISNVRVFSPNDGMLAEIGARDCGFAYRDSIFGANGDIILSAELKLHNGNIDEIRSKTEENMRARIQKQPLSEPSAGSVFRRPEGYFAGALIDKAGLRGYAVGGAKVSEKHAGFIVNSGGATSEDVLKLIGYIKKRVFESSGVMLCEEIIYIK